MSPINGMFAGVIMGVISTVYFYVFLKENKEKECYPCIMKDGEIMKLKKLMNKQTFINHYNKARDLHYIARIIRKTIRRNSNKINSDTECQLFDIAHLLENKSLNSYNKAIKMAPEAPSLYVCKGNILYLLVNHPMGDGLAYSVSDIDYYGKMLKSFNKAMTISDDKESIFDKIYKICPIYSWPPEPVVGEEEMIIENIPF